MSDLEVNKTRETKTRDLVRNDASKTKTGDPEGN